MEDSSDNPTESNQHNAATPTVDPQIPITQEQAVPPQFVVGHIQPDVPELPAKFDEPSKPTDNLTGYAPSADVVPVPVVKVLSPRGVEYVFLTITLFAGAYSLAGALISLVNGDTSFSVLGVPVATLLVSLPIFAWLFLRLKKAELNNPELKLDQSKRRSTQFIQIATFLISFITLIVFVASILYKIAGQYSGSIVKLIIDALIMLLVSGGILFYYWQDEHRKV